jgi:hypothetical protein
MCLYFLKNCVLKEKRGFIASYGHGHGAGGYSGGHGGGIISAGYGSGYGGVGHGYGGAAALAQQAANQGKHFNSFHSILKNKQKR